MWLRSTNTPSLRLCVSRSLHAFTLTELLVVIGLIVLLLALAVPAFNAITGGRSIDASANQISAFLGRARMEAIGLQETRGVMFFIDPRNKRPTMAIVRASTDSKTNDTTGTNATVGVWLDLVGDKEYFSLPAGVGIEIIDNCILDSAKVRQDDGYIGFNLFTNPGYVVPVGGVVLFDGNGKLLSMRYGFRCSTGANASGPPTAMGKLLMNSDNAPSAADYAPPIAPVSQPAPNDEAPTRSAFGFVLFEEDKFIAGAGASDIETAYVDRQAIGQAYNAIEKTKEDWLDTNSVPFVINRYNGTLVRGD